ncbi:unnamed protein product [Amoebophrya sp. A120]|nr:unnamed protein product [Amoebophrya sp. A120]|eukprot:GSA120T00002347001.1
MRVFLLTALAAVSAEARSLLSRSNTHHMDLVQKATNATVTGEVYFSDNKIFGAGVGGSQSSMDCQKVSANYRESSTEPRIKVCGVNLKVTLFLWNDCQAGSVSPLEIGACDSSKPASTCEEFSPGSEGAPAGMQHFLSYQIGNCEA